MWNFKYKSFDDGLNFFKKTGYPLPLVSDDDFIEFGNYDISGENILECELSCVHTEKPFVKEFIKAIESMGAKYIFADVFFSGGNEYDESFGIYSGERIPISQLIEIAQTDSPTFALIVSILKFKLTTLEKTKSILSDGADPNIYVNRKPLLHHTMNFDTAPEQTIALLNAGADPNATDYNDKFYSSLHQAICSADQDYQDVCLEKIESLVTHGVDIDRYSGEKLTPLMYAVKYGYENIVEYLIESGVNLSLATVEGSTILEYAKSYNNKSIIKLLDKNKSKIKKKNKGSKIAKLTDRCKHLIAECDSLESDYERVLLVLKNNDVMGFYRDGDDLICPKIKESISTEITKYLKTEEISYTTKNDFNRPEEGIYLILKALTELIKESHNFKWNSSNRLADLLNLLGVETFRI